ncbi:hypothetical protein ABIB80_007672, partial [Bradyrhizobium sp. i1.15.2]
PGQADWPDGILDRVGVELETSAFEEAGQPLPMIEDIADVLGERLTDRPRCNVNLQISTGRDHRDARSTRMTRDSCSASMAVRPQHDITDRDLKLDCRSLTLPQRTSQHQRRECRLRRLARRQQASASKAPSPALDPPVRLSILARHLGHLGTGNRLSATIRALSASERTRRLDGPPRTSSRLTAPANEPSKCASFLLSNPSRPPSKPDASRTAIQIRSKGSG